MSDKPSTQTDTTPRKPWSPPRYSRIRAGEAELGANPIRPEGAFAMGS